MSKKIKTTMSRMPQIWDETDGDKTFTVGRGKRHYHIWVCGRSGLHYCYNINTDGFACKRRAVEPTSDVTIHIHE